MSWTWHLSLGIEHYGLESQGRLGTCSGVDFPERAGGKAAANFHSNVSSKAAGIVKPFSFWRSLGEREGQGRRTCEESLHQGNSRIIHVTQTRSVLFILSQFGSNYKICSFHLVLERSHQQWSASWWSKFWNCHSLTAVSWEQRRCLSLWEWGRASRRRQAADILQQRDTTNQACMHTRV